MAERSTFDSFEQRIAEGLERYVARATDPKPAIEIAAAAMRPRGLVVRARNVPRTRRLLLLGLAAALLVPAAYIGANSIQPPGPDLLHQVRPFNYVSIFVRRNDGPEPGISIFAVRPDGDEVLVRKLPDSLVAGHGTWSVGGTVSRSGWLAMGLENTGGSWPMVLVDLRDERVEPWVINDADLGGIGPRWGPTGLVAADAGGNGGRVVIVDPETHSTRIMSMRGGLVGGGPSIVWSADGSGIVGSTGSGGYDTVPLDGSDPRAGVGDVFDPGGAYGPGLAELRTCSADVQCPGGDDGRIERIELDGSARTIWRQQGDDRAITERFGERVDEYWLTLDHDSGRKIAFVHVLGGREDTVATVNRDVDWGYVDAPLEAPDHATAIVWVYRGTQPAAVLVPLSGAAPTFHSGHFAGFVASTASAVFASGQYGTPVETMPVAGQPYALPSLDELIAAEQGLNPGRTVLGKASHEAVDGDTGIQTFEVPRDQPGAGEAYLDCFGPSSVTATSGAQSVTNPCLRAGADSFGANYPVIVTASGDTSWRLVIYSP